MLILSYLKHTSSLICCKDIVYKLPSFSDFNYKIYRIFQKIFLLTFGLPKENF
jgi:hypothetical protein